MLHELELDSLFLKRRVWVFSCKGLGEDILGGFDDKEGGNHTAIGVFDLWVKV